MKFTVNDKVYLVRGVHWFGPFVEGEEELLQEAYDELKALG